jgi:hypothetical protein
VPSPPPQQQKVAAGSSARGGTDRWQVLAVQPLPACGPEAADVPWV